MSWKTEILKTETALNRQPIKETVVPNFTLFEQLEPQTYRIYKHNFVNGRNPKNNLIQVYPIGNAPCDVHCHMGLCLKTVMHIPECGKERCGYKWKKTHEVINGSKTKMFLGQQFPATVGSKTNEENEEDEIYFEYLENNASRKITRLKHTLRKSNKKLKGMKEAKHHKRKNKRESKIKKTIPQKLNKDPYVVGAIHTDPEVLPESIPKRHNARYPYNTTADTINDIH